MVIFHSYVSLPEGRPCISLQPILPKIRTTPGAFHAARAVAKAIRPSCCAQGDAPATELLPWEFHGFHDTGWATPLKKNEFVSWDDNIPNWMEK